MQMTPSLDMVDTQGPNGFRVFISMLQKMWRNLAGVINGKISFGTGSQSDNIDGVWLTANFSLANTDATFTHNLGRIPVGYLVMTKNQAGNIFTGTIAATTTQITLQSSTAGETATLFVL